ncbi:MAG: hypothetical protein J3K34DRAFT_521228, partial [Monoraphidium minutum]
ARSRRGAAPTRPARPAAAVAAVVRCRHEPPGVVHQGDGADGAGGAAAAPLAVWRAVALRRGPAAADAAAQRRRRRRRAVVARLCVCGAGAGCVPGGRRHAVPLPPTAVV